MGVVAHVFTGDEIGDCTECPLPANHPMHVAPTAVPAVVSGRPINLASKDEGMARAASSMASEDFRTTFFLAMAEVATTREFFSTNDAWDLLEARGYSRSGSAQATGTIGPSGCSIGLWKRTDQKAINTSGNLHSSDDGVRVYKSLIRGQHLDDWIDVIKTKTSALREAAEKREQAKAGTEPRLIPDAAVESVEYRLVDPDGVTSPLLAAHVEQARKELPEWTIQRQTVIRTPWETM